MTRSARLLAACAAAVIASAAASASAPQAKPAPEVRRAFDLVRHDGAAVTDRSFHGQVLLVFFGFTTCPDVCPMGLATVARATRHLEDRGIRVTPVFITVDPDRDTTELLRQYVKEFHPRMVGLTGSPRNIAHAAAAYGVQYGVQKTPATYYVWHTSNTFLVGPRGALLETFGPYVSPAEVVSKTSAALRANQQNSIQ